MDKHYLLIFNEDWADEHDIPALACMTEAEYKAWLKTPSGELRPEYEQEKAKIDEYTTTNNAMRAKAREVLGSDWGSISFDKWPKDLLGEYKAVEAKYKDVNISYYGPKKVESELHARLGNNGEGFEEAYSHLHLMEEFVQEELVKVTEVDKSFYDVFKKARLDDLSLCNIFEL